MVGSRDGEEGPLRHTGQLVSDNGRQQAAQDGQDHEGAGPQGVRKKSVDAMR